MMRVLRRLALALVLVVLLGVAAFGLFAWQVDRLGRVDYARPADVIVVLGARVTPDGRPGSDLTSRTLHAVDLWQDGFAQHIVCSGGFKNEPLSAAAVCRNYAIELGVPPGQVWIADGSTNTSEDARASAEVMAQHGWQSAILVSHPLHLFRARWFFHRVGVEAVTSPTTTATERIFLPLRVWYAVREAGAILLATLDDMGWLPPRWRTYMQAVRDSLP